MIREVNAVGGNSPSSENPAKLPHRWQEFGAPYVFQDCL
jgi:hypothetical protein